MVATELVNNEFNVVDVDVDRKMFSRDGSLVTSGCVTLQVDRHRVYVELTSPDGIVAPDGPDVYSAFLDKVVKERIKGIATNAVELLIVDCGGL